MGSTRPGSRAHSYVQLIRARAEELGRGIEVGEIRTVYVQETGKEAPDSLTAELSSLKRRGVLEAVGGRPGHTLYAPAGMELEKAHREEDDAVIVLEALWRAYRRLERALSTREVAQEVERGERELSSDHPDAVKKRLETLARRTERGPEGSQEPKVVRIKATSALGHASNHWLPAGVPEADRPAREVVAPGSKADALRRAVASAKEELGRPIAKPELRWWLESPAAPGVLADALASNRLGRRLSDTGGTDREHPGEAGRLHAVTTRFTCHGGAPVRWTVGPPTDREEALCRLEDATVALQVPDEVRSIQGLERRGDRFGQNVLLTLASVRRRVLGSRLHEAATPFDGSELAAELESVGATLRSWVEGTPTLTDDQLEHRTRDLRERDRLLGALDGVLMFMVDDDPPPVAVVGEAGTASLQELMPLLDNATNLLGLAPHKARRLIERVRRFPTSGDSGQERIGAADENPLSHVDRIEAIDAVYELFGVPRARSLVSDARRLLGHVLRDVALLQGLLDELGDRMGFPRGPLVVALGMLGESVEFERAVPDGADHDAAAAWVLAVVLAKGEGAEGVLEASRQTAFLPAGRILETAVRRTRGGYLLSAIG